MGDFDSYHMAWIHRIWYKFIAFWYEFISFWYEIKHAVLEFDIETLAKNQVLLERLKCEIKIILSLKMTDLFRFLNSWVQSVAKPGTIYYHLGKNSYQIGMDSYQVGMFKFIPIRSIYLVRIPTP